MERVRISWNLPRGGAGKDNLRDGEKKVRETDTHVREKERIPQ